jgi:hypothetical protein
LPFNLSEVLHTVSMYYKAVGHIYGVFDLVGGWQAT